MKKKTATLKKALLRMDHQLTHIFQTIDVSNPEQLKLLIPLQNYSDIHKNLNSSLERVEKVREQLNRLSERLNQLVHIKNQSESLVEHLNEN
jgi:hypothetical protein